MTSSQRDRPLLSRWGTARRQAARREGGEDDSGGIALFERLALAGRACDLGEGTLRLAEELVLAHPGADDAGAARADRDHLALLFVCALAAARQGSTRLPLDTDPGDPLGQFIGPIAAAAGISESVSELASAVAEVARDAAASPEGLVGGPGDYCPLILDEGSIYLQRHHAREMRLARALRSRTGQSSRQPAAIASALADVCARPASPGGTPHTLSDEQKAAIADAAASPFSVIAGGPGTGKTAIIVALLRTLARAGPPPDSVALCAPTGKAAKRMAESIRAGLTGIADPAPADKTLAAEPPEPQTLHRLLGYQPAADRFRHHPNHPIPADIVIADEASMIDLELADRLFRALGPDAQLVLLGDADQLPSVDAGAVFRDLLAAGQASGSAHRLTRSYRMDPSDPAGRSILVAARALGRGEASQLLDPSSEAHAPTRTEAHALAFEGVEILDTGGEPAAVTAFLRDWHRRFVAPDARRRALVAHVYRQEGGLIDEADRARVEELFAHHARQRLLAVTRQLSTGADALNAYLHERALEGFAALERRPDFVAGEPISMRKNDYRRQLFNGDQGIVLSVAAGDDAQRFCAVFPAKEGYAVYPIDALRPHIELAYALTVHRAQGSEFDCVGLVLPHSELPLLSRELVYTALTRAKRAAVLAGARRLVARASRSAPRFTRLAP